MQYKRQIQNQNPLLNGQPFFKPVVQRQADLQVKTETIPIDEVLEKIPEILGDLEKIKRQIISGKGDLCKLAIAFLKHGLNTSATIDGHTPMLLNSFSILVANCSSFGRYIKLKEKAITDPGVFQVHKHFHGNDNVKNSTFDTDDWHQAVKAGTDAKTREEILGVGGFYHRKKDTINMPSDGTIGSALHETMHRLSKEMWRNATFINGKSELNEGATQYFTDLALNEFGLPPVKGHLYGPLVEKIKKLVSKTGGVDLLAKTFFQNDVHALHEILFKLKLTTQHDRGVSDPGQKIMDALK